MIDRIRIINKKFIFTVAGSIHFGLFNLTELNLLTEFLAGFISKKILRSKSLQEKVPGLENYPKWCIECFLDASRIIIDLLLVGTKHDANHFLYLYSERIVDISAKMASRSAFKLSLRFALK